MKLKKTVSVLLASLLLGSAATVTASALEPHGTGILCRNWLKNDPNYTFSESYKKSVWYENFTALELGENERNNVLGIAISQLGYHEGEVGDYSGTNTTSRGNCIEYARLLIPHYNDNAYEWCACFVNWCLNQAHIDYASSEIGCWKWVGELKKMGMWEHSAAYKGTYTPKPADMIFFNWDGNNNSSGHIGYVLYTTETRVFTIEGNADNNVTVRSYALDDPNVIGYGTPPYEENGVPTIDHSYKEGMPRGEYVLNAANLYLFKEKGSERIARLPLGSRVTLLGEDGDYARVVYGEKIGYVRKANLYLMSAVTGEDTLTYDANGGAGAPASLSVPYGEETAITESAPTLEGDRFLGWSLVPYNYKVDYAPGAKVTLSGDTTLYAVWEKRSLELAKAKLEAGEVAEFTRPESITNSSALLLGTLSDLTTAFDGNGNHQNGTTLSMVQDDACGTVLRVSSHEACNDPYFTLDYARICRELCLAPVRAESVNYMIFKVKDVSLNNVFFEVFYDCGKGAVQSVSKLLISSDDWQYVVLDMSDADGWNGELSRLRIDWQKASSAEENVLLISDIYFTSSKVLKDAIVSGQYVYPEEETIVIPETESETSPETVTRPETESVTEEETGTDTEAASEGTGTNTSATEASGEDNGCASALGASAIVGMAVAAVALVVRKKED